MALDNPIHLAFLLLILLLIFGAKRLPEMGRSLGAGLRSFKESINGDPARPHIEELTATTTPEADHAQASGQHTPLKPVA